MLPVGAEFKYPKLALELFGWQPPVRQNLSSTSFSC